RLIVVDSDIAERMLVVKIARAKLDSHCVGSGFGRLHIDAEDSGSRGTGRREPLTPIRALELHLDRSFLHGLEITQASEVDSEARGLTRDERRILHEQLGSISPVRDAQTFRLFRRLLFLLRLGLSRNSKRRKSRK